MIENNVNRKDKTLWTDNKQGDKIHYYRANNANEEAYYVVKKFKNKLEIMDVIMEILLFYIVLMHSHV